MIFVTNLYVIFPEKKKQRHTYIDLSGLNLYFLSFDRAVASACSRTQDPLSGFYALNT
jgi:hypothetical protein